MEKINVGGIEIEIDRDRTSSLYDPSLNWCQCEFCTNANTTQTRYIHADQVETLNAFGLDPYLPCLREPNRRRPFDPPQHIRWLSCWFIYGKLVGDAPTSRVKFDRWNWMWADTSRAATSAWDSGLKRLDGDPDLIYLFASNLLPWLYGEVCEFRDERALPCSKCGHSFRLTGYLKRRSMIPVWENLPHLTAVLRERKNRVYVEFCTSCGQMEYEIVANRRPFRKPNELERLIRKRGYGAHFVITRPIEAVE